MSVFRSAKLGYGFMVHADDLEQMTERGVELYEAFIDSDFTVRLDGYADYPTDYFFGLTIFSLDEGEAASVPNVRNFDREKYTQMMEEFKLYCPNRRPFLPKDYILFCVD